MLGRCFAPGQHGQKKNITTETGGRKCEHFSKKHHAVEYIACVNCSLWVAYEYNEDAFK